MQSLFTQIDAWTGGDYELAIEYKDLSARQIQAVITSLWDHPALDGCHLLRNVEPDEQARVLPSSVELDQELLGVASLPNAVFVTCSSSMLLETESIWIHFGIPLGSLLRAYPIGAFPFADGASLSWRKEIDNWLLDIAHHIHRIHPFRLGVTGWLDALDLTVLDVISQGVPEERWEGYLIPMQERLSYFPPNQGAPLSI